MSAPSCKFQVAATPKNATSASAACPILPDGSLNSGSRFLGVIVTIRLPDTVETDPSVLMPWEAEV